MICDAYPVSPPNGAYSGEPGHVPAYRCRACEGYYTLLTGTVFAKIRQRPATLVLLLRSIAHGKFTASLARELWGSRKPLHTLRQCIQANVNATAPTKPMAGTACEADAFYQNVGEKQYPHVGGPINGRGSVPLPMIAHPSSV